MEYLEDFARLLFTPPNELLAVLQNKELNINFDIESNEQMFASVLLDYLDSESLFMLAGLMNELCIQNNSSYSIFFNNSLTCLYRQADVEQKRRIKNFFQKEFFCIDPEYLADICNKLELVIDLDQLSEYAIYLALNKLFKKSIRVMKDFGITVRIK